MSEKEEILKKIKAGIAKRAALKVVEVNANEEDNINVYNNILNPKIKTIFYNNTGVQIQIQTHVYPENDAMVVQLILPQPVSQELLDLLKLGDKRLDYYYLYTNANANANSKKIKLRLVKNPTLKCLKMRIQWLFQNGYGVTFNSIK